MASMVKEAGSRTVASLRPLPESRKEMGLRKAGAGAAQRVGMRDARTVGGACSRNGVAMTVAAAPLLEAALLPNAALIAAALLSIAVLLPVVQRMLLVLVLLPAAPERRSTAAPPAISRAKHCTTGTRKLVRPFRAEVCGGGDSQSVTLCVP